MSQPAGQDKPALARMVASGAVWGVGGAVAYQMVALLVQTALTYLLTKEDYGVYGKAVALLGLCMFLQQVGFNEVLLRRQRRLHLWLSTAFWFPLALGLSGSTLLLAIAWPLAKLYGNPELFWLLLLAAPLPLLRSLNVLPSIVLVNTMRFRVHYGLMLANAVATSLMTLALAFAGLGAKSFAVALLMVEPLSALALWRLARPQFSGGPRPARWRFLVRDLRFVFGSNAARWVRSYADPLVLGLFAGAGVVGVYFFAQSMLLQIVRVVTLNLSGVLLPALNRVADDPVRQVRALLRAARVLLLVGAPLCVGVGVAGSLFVRVFLDAEKWHDLPPVLAALAAGMMFRLLDEPINALIVAQGRFRLSFRISTVTAMLYLSVCVLGAQTGAAINTAIAASLYYFFAGPTLLFLAIRTAGYTWFDAARVFFGPAAFAVAGIAPWALLDAALPGEGRVRDAWVLAALICGSAITCLVLARQLRLSGWSELVARLTDMAPTHMKPLVARVGGTSGQGA